MEQYQSAPLPRIAGPPSPGGGGFLVDLRQVAASQQLPQLDVNSFVVGAGSGAAIGRGISGLADGGSRIAEEIFASKNRQAVDAASAKLAAASQDISMEIAKEPDHTKWAGIFESQAAKWEGVLLKDQTLSPAARDAITAKFSEWKIRGSSSTLRAAFDSSIRKEAEGLEGGRIMALNAGNYEEAERLTQEQERRGLIGADTAARQRVQAGTARQRKERDDEVKRLAEAVEADPWEAKDALEAGHFAFDAEEKAAAIADVERTIAAQQRKAIQEARDAIIIGAAPDDIDRMADGYRLGAEDRAALHDFRRKYLEAKASAGPLDREGLAALRGEIESYKGDEKSDPLAAKWGDLVNRAEILTAGGGKEGDLTRGALMQSLYLRHPFQERRKGGPDDEALAEIEAKFTASIEALAADGGFGPLQKAVPNLKPDAEGKLVQDTEEKFKLAANPEARRKQAYAQASLWRSLMADYKSNPDKWADPNYIDEWLWGPKGRLRELSAGAKVEQMRQESRGPASPLLPFNLENPAAAPTAEQLEELLK